MVDEKNEVVIYTDGACEPNPGAGGYGIVLLSENRRKEISGGFRLTTNNRMEIYAAIKGLEILKFPCKATIYSDSQYQSAKRAEIIHQPVHAQVPYDQYFSEIGSSNPFGGAGFGGKDQPDLSNIAT